MFAKVTKSITYLDSSSLSISGVLRSPSDAKNTYGIWISKRKPPNLSSEMLPK